MEKQHRIKACLLWRGVLASGGDKLRRIVAGMLALSCVALAITQWGFIGVQFADGGTAYLIFMLAPVALAAMLLGTLMGGGMGLVSGVVLSVHSQVLPLDYYELTYVRPIASVVLTGVYGLVLGLLFALVVQGESRGVRRYALVVLACLGASWVFSAGFTVSAAAASALRTAGGAIFGDGQSAQLGRLMFSSVVVSGGMGFQAFGDAIITSIVAVVGLRRGVLGLSVRGDIGLRGAFGVRLSAMVLAVFMVVASVGYVVVTLEEFEEAAVAMRSEAYYLLGQVWRMADYNGAVYDTLMEYMRDDVDANTVFASLADGGVLNSLIVGYTEDDDGLVAVALDGSSGLIIGQNTLRLTGVDALVDAFPDDVMDAIERSKGQGTLERIVYAAPSKYNDLVDLAFGATQAEIDDLLSMQVGYLVAVTDGDYQVIMIRPASMVFAGRIDVMAWLTLSSLAILVAVFFLAWYLLDLLVARRVDAINLTLAEIAEGNLDARSLPEGTHEFVDLSVGVNTTVSALQEWIAEAESRMDAELATAKAIQESALPSVFPPFPDILRFDIYASMNAAKEVGGDFYDFFLVGDDNTPEAGRLAFVMADVSGKGVPAALFMMKAKTQIQDYLASGMELGEAVENANHQLCEGNDAGMFVTAWVGVLDYGTGHVQFVNAGHNPPLLWRRDRWEWVRERSGLPLGLFDGMPYRTHEIDCEVGDQILLYTDGVTEAFSVEEEQYGEDRLERLANDSLGLHPRELVERLRRSVAKHAEGAEQSDDITILSLEVGVPPEEKAMIVVPAELSELDAVNAFIHVELDHRLAPMRAQGQLDIAVEELFVNICNYAYEGMDGNVERTARVTCAYSADPPSLTVELIDDGVPWNPLAKPDAKRAGDYASMDEVPIGGLGILMAKRNVSEMSYERVGESNVVTLVKRW